MKILIVSSSLDPDSRSEELSRLCTARLAPHSDAMLICLKDYPLSGRDLHQPKNAAAYAKLHHLVSMAHGLVFASPVYNWSCCAELKRFIEVIGTTPPDGSVRGAFFDKVLAFVNAAGAPQSYMAFTSLAASMMLDFKCIVSPYNLYVTNRDWADGQLGEKASARLDKSMDVFLELVQLLSPRRYRSEWEI